MWCRGVEMEGEGGMVMGGACGEGMVREGVCGEGM